MSFFKIFDIFFLNDNSVINNLSIFSIDKLQQFLLQ